MAQGDLVGKPAFRHRSVLGRHLLQHIPMLTHQLVLDPILCPCEPAVSVRVQRLLLASLKEHYIRYTISQHRFRRRATTSPCDQYSYTSDQHEQQDWSWGGLWFWYHVSQAMSSFQLNKWSDTDGNPPQRQCCIFRPSGVFARGQRRDL